MSRRRRKTWIFLLGLCTVSLATGAAVRLWADWPRVALAPEIPTPTSSTPFEAQLFPPLPHTPLPSPPPPTPSPSPSISFSSLSPEESDTVAISISGVSATGTARGTFASSNISFLRAANGRWVGLAGIDAKMAPGAYPLSLTLPDGAVRRETVQVRARDYPVTELAVTDELRKKGYTPPAIALNVAAENARLAAALAGSPPRAYFDGPFVNPLDFMENVGEYGNIRVSGGVGLRHLGVDLTAKIGTPIHAINGGKVRFAEELTNYGKTMVVDHGLGIFSLYLHLSEFLVAPGDVVARGATIGRTGNTGYVLAPHLHFSMRLGPASIDPLRFLTAAAWAFEK